jgi:hypothetical protein
MMNEELQVMMDLGVTSNRNIAPCEKKGLMGVAQESNKKKNKQVQN